MGQQKLFKSLVTVLFTTTLIGVEILAVNAGAQLRGSQRYRQNRTILVQGHGRCETRSSNAGDELVRSAFQNQRSNLQVEGQGKVIKILADDLEGSKHQRFILRLNSGQTLLIAHNIDLAPRINSLRVGDFVTFYGEYEYHPQGGVIHWTHHDPRNVHVGGWIKHCGRTYQ